MPPSTHKIGGAGSSFWQIFGKIIPIDVVVVWLLSQLDLYAIGGEEMALLTNIEMALVWMARMYRRLHVSKSHSVSHHISGFLVFFATYEGYE